MNRLDEIRERNQKRTQRMWHYNGMHNEIAYLLDEVERKERRIQELELALSHKNVEKSTNPLLGFKATDLYR